MSLFYLILYLYIGSIGIAFLVSLRSFKKPAPVHLRFFSVLLGVTFVVEFTATIIFSWLHLNKYRSGLYTAFSLPEFLAYAWYFYLISSKRWVRKLLVGFMCSFPFIWAFTVFFGYGFNNWNSPQVAIGGFFTVLFALIYINHRSSVDAFVSIKSDSEFWIAIGIIIFYSCEIPYLGALHYLINNYMLLAKKLLRLSMVLNTVMYSCFIYAFLWMKTRSLSPSS
jgi:hypothetical protein